MAAIWKGTISFGLVTIPVELHGAVKDSRPRFRLLHAKDKSPVKYERVCQREGKSVAWEDLVKGYEYEKGKFVVLTKEDLKTAALEKTKSLEIVDFVAEDEIDDRYFETSYYAVPSKGGERGYSVLREAIRSSGRVGIGKIILREVQHLAALTAVEDALVITLMRFADELVDVSRFSFPKGGTVKPRELEMAKTLIDSLAEKWEPEKYHDDYRANLMRVINAKLRGKKVVLTSEEETQHADVVDLMERLRQSIEARGSGKRRPAKRAKGKRAA